MSLFVCGGGGALFLYHEAVRDLDGQASSLADHFFEQVREHGGADFNWEDRHEVQEWLPGEHQRELVELYRHGKLYFRSSKLGASPLPS
ncbi:MAG: hypothetical protein WC718_19465, partial [Phycisphaerales bacterium]